MIDKGTTPGEQTSLSFFRLSRHVLWEETNDLAPPAVDGVDPNPDELVYGPLTPLEVSYLVHGPLRVDPGGPGQKNPEAKNFCCFPFEFDQLIKFTCHVISIKYMALHLPIYKTILKFKYHFFSFYFFVGTGPP